MTGLHICTDCPCHEVLRSGAPIGWSRRSGGGALARLECLSVSGGSRRMPAAAAPGRTGEGVPDDSTQRACVHRRRRPVRLRVGLGVPRVHERARRCRVEVRMVRHLRRDRPAGRDRRRIARLGSRDPARGGRPGWRWLALAPLLLAIAPMLMPEALVVLFTEGLGGGAIAVALLAIGGGFAISGRGALWARIACGILSFLLLAGVSATALVLGRAAAPGNEARGWWTLLLAASLLAILVLAASIPFRPVVGENAADERRSARPQGDRPLRREDSTNGGSPPGPPGRERCRTRHAGSLRGCGNRRWRLRCSERRRRRCRRQER